MYPDEWRGMTQDEKSVRVMTGILDHEKPNLVVLNGDLINGDSVRISTGTQYIDRILQPLVHRNLSWASTYGNHDHQPNLSGNLLLVRERHFAGSRTKSMVWDERAGITNYYLPVYSADCMPQHETDCTPKLILWFFDSRGGYYYKSGGIFKSALHQPNWVDASVVEWFERTQMTLIRIYKRVIPSMAFAHIPVYASKQLQRRGIHPNRQPGINNEAVSPQAGSWCPDGRHMGGCTYGKQDAAFMKALAKTPGLIGFFTGHDHANSWCDKWSGPLPDVEAIGSGVNLCYGQHTGYGGYGDLIRGSREILVSVKGLKRFEAETYIHTEKDGIVGAISLNSTYGTDLYPATPYERTYLHD